MSRAVRIELPFPPSGLSPNARLHWRSKAKLTAEFREDCGWRALLENGWVSIAGQSYGKPIKPPVEATVTFVVPDRRKRDEDNLLAMLKPAWDGLVDAGVLAGDDHERFKVGKVSIRSLNDTDVNRCSWCVARNHGRCHGPCNCEHDPKVIVELLSRVGAGHG